MPTLTVINNKRNSPNAISPGSSSASEVKRTNNV